MGSGATNDLIQSNYLGADITGNAYFSNQGNGVDINSGASNDTIGGTTTAARNIIAGNEFGVYVNGSAATNNTIAGNYIGLGANGSRLFRIFMAS